MENLVVTLETAKKLKAAGFLQNTAALRWSSPNRADNKWHVSQYMGLHPKLEFAAPTAQEIADQLPEHLEDKLYGYYLTIGADEGWQASYIESLEEPKIWTEIYACRADTMAEALALLWLKLKETN